MYRVNKQNGYEIITRILEENQEQRGTTSKLRKHIKKFFKKHLFER